MRNDLTDELVLLYTLRPELSIMAGTVSGHYALVEQRS